mmetsp:Transcript_150273/g.418696  ORF Transcript_150273/g.418696 Transcript_150273/m.418696 type:complete len:97 (-) Transcript_150273:102-392(-)
MSRSTWPIEIKSFFNTFEVDVCGAGAEAQLWHSENGGAAGVRGAVLIATSGGKGLTPITVGDIALIAARGGQGGLVGGMPCIAAGPVKGTAARAVA